MSLNKDSDNTPKAKARRPEDIERVRRALAENDRRDSFGCAWNEAAFLHEEETARLRRAGIIFAITLTTGGTAIYFAWLYL